MARSSSKTLVFPLGGVGRRGGYRDQTRPFSAPWAVNVRGVGPLESRRRGGSRPGLDKISLADLGAAIAGLFPLIYVDASGTRRYDLIYIADGRFGYVRVATATATSGLILINGVAVQSNAVDVGLPDSVATANPIGATDAYSVATLGGKLYVADSVLRCWDPLTGVVGNIAASAGTVPVNQPLVAAYRDRIILAGADHVWYAARQGTPTDWNFGADMGDEGRAVAGQSALAGQLGDVPKALIPVRDQVLVFAGANRMWALRGDPTTGSMERVSEEWGVIAPSAWATTPDGLLAFLSNDGVYLWNTQFGSAPTRFSEERVPEELRNVSATTNMISMAYDPVGRGFHLFITPSSGDGTHWWLDIDNKAMWPVVFQTAHQPFAAVRNEGTGLSDVVIGCKDGYLRKFDVDNDDDGSDIESHVLIGPIRIAADDVRDAILAEIHGIMAGNASDVTWRIVQADSAEVAVDNALADVNTVLGGGAASNVEVSGTWSSGRNFVARPRSRGMWVTVWLSATTAWAYEAVTLVSRQLGRVR